jgi:small conductance mechanosensitive channel
MPKEAAALVVRYTDLVEVLLPKLVSWTLSLAGAIGILIAGWLFARVVARIVHHLLDKHPNIDSTVKPFITSAVRYAILVGVVLAAIAQIGVQTASILAIVGAASLAIGLALQGTLSNVAAGVMLLVLRPLKVEEYVDAEGISGTVKEVGLFNTTLHSIDGLCLFVPNAKLWGSTIRNYSRLGRRRFDITIGIDYAADIDETREKLLSLMKADTRVLPNPDAEVFVAEFGDHAVLVTMRGWALSSDYLGVVADLKRAAKYKLDEAGVTIPYPQHVVHIVSHDTEPRKALGA